MLESKQGSDLDYQQLAHLETLLAEASLVAHSLCLNTAFQAWWLNARDACATERLFPLLNIPEIQQQITDAT